MAKYLKVIHHFSKLSMCLISCLNNYTSHTWKVRFKLRILRLHRVLLDRGGHGWHPHGCGHRGPRGVTPARADILKVHEGPHTQRCRYHGTRGADHTWAWAHSLQEAAHSWWATKVHWSRLHPHPHLQSPRDSGVHPQEADLGKRSTWA